MKNGLAIIHSNHLETLAEAAFTWCQSQPLAPLENELFLVQSNGMADWLKLKMAQFQGISAAVEYPMPSSFIWRLYRSVLSNDLALHSPYDKGSLQWRIYDLLPELIKREEFARPRQFLLDDNGQLNSIKHFQLSRKLADLYDQYQQYRGDWLLDWQADKPCVLADKSAAFSADEAWQKLLWQQLVEQISEEHLSRADLHKQFKQALANHKDKLPHRIVLFGVNSLSEQVFDALCALAPYTQLLMLVLNPSEIFWQLRSQEEQINHALLDSWGGRGRDFTRLLDEKYEELPDHLKANIQQAYVYLNQDELVTDKQDSILLQLQQDMQNNLPISEINGGEKRPLPAQAGLAFYPCYSRQREVEILHDNLLELFERQPDLNYHDVIVMVPNIDQYTAHIEAAFGRYKQNDKRYLHYSISDRNKLTDNPLFAALDYLLALPEKRLLQSEVFFLLEQPAIRSAVQLSLDDIEQIKQWIEQSNIRWGLDEKHKADILSSTSIEDWRNNTWQQGLDRLLAGYCGGSAALWGDDENSHLINGIAIDEVSANQGLVLGNFINFVQKLQQFRRLLQHSYSVYGGDDPHSWQSVFDSLLENFFAAEEALDQDIIVLLQKALTAWRDDVELAELNPNLSLNTARQAWLEKVTSSGQSQRLSFNGIMFCTLMPMRALPFKHVFLLGMNDGDYPREQISPDFDLMQYEFKTGDRDRRSDDQYLFLEALLSVRDSLSISWVGKDISDNSKKEASTLVSQLKDYIDLIYQEQDGKPASDYLTKDYPLASFSRSYFEENNQHITYANEWWHLHQEKAAKAQQAITINHQLDGISIHDLVALFKNPCGVFYQQSLGVRYYDYSLVNDEEPFEINGLEKWKIRQAALTNDLKTLQALKRSGELPAGYYADKTIAQTINDADRINQRYLEVLGESASEVADYHYQLSFKEDAITLQGVLDSLWQTPSRNLQVYKTASNAFTKGWRLDLLAHSWLCHVIACASGLDVETTLVSLGNTAKFETLAANDALDYLSQLIEIYLIALNQPLPLALKSATAYLNRKDDAEESEIYSRVKSAYADGYMYSGDESDTYISKSFADFDEYWSASAGDYKFTDLAELVYQPMLDSIIPFKKGKKDND